MTEEYKTHLLQGLGDLKERMLNGRLEWSISSQEKMILLLADAVQALVLDAKPKE